MVAQRREELRRLVDELPDAQVEPALRLLKGLEAETDPLVRLLAAAPEDDEELTPEEAARLRQGEEDWRRGDLLPFDIGSTDRPDASASTLGDRPTAQGRRLQATHDLLHM